MDTKTEELYTFTDENGGTYSINRQTLRLFSLRAGNPDRAVRAELVRIADERDRLRKRLEEAEKDRAGYKDLLSDELLRGAAEIREMARKSEAADRQLVAHLGAIVGLENATVLQVGDQPPFAMAICGELLMAAWKLRQERDQLQARVARLAEGK